MTVTRLERLSAAMQQHQYAAVALMPSANMRYLTGLQYGMGKRIALALLPRDGQPSMVLPAMDTHAVEAGAQVPLRLYPWADGEGPDAALHRCMHDLGLDGAAIGVEYTAMRVQELRALQHAAPGFRDVDATELLTGLRVVKDADELALMREAVRIVEVGLREVVSHVRPGITERQLATIWEQAMQAAGSEGPAFATAIAGGPNGASPHHNNGDRPLQSGDLIVMDGGATYGGYCSDITRTFALGEPGSAAREIYAAVLAANEAGRAAVQFGASGAQVDQAARDVIAAAGYGEFFLHRTGHGFGLEIHEPPFIVAGSDAPIPVGATFTIEPGVYLAGLGGVRIEDDVVLTPEGAVTLTSFPRELTLL
jgi:Xaa-Pro dipeptidase